MGLRRKHSAQNISCDAVKQMAISGFDLSTCNVRRVRARATVKLCEGSRVREPRLPDCVKTTALVTTVLKARSKCSFTTRKLRFFATFRLVLTALVTFLHGLLRIDARSSVSPTTNAYP